MSMELNKESVEQAGGDERAADEKPRATRCPDCGEHDLMPGDLCACGYETDPATGYACSECDGSGEGCVGEVCRECGGSGWFVTPEQARAALAQPSPAQAEQPTADDYEEVLADHRRLVREMDVLLNGEACAAKQAMLCDLVSQVEAEVRKSGQPLLVSAERYRWLRNDDNWGADDSEGQGTSKWANLGELSGTDFDAYLDQLRGSNPVMDIDPEHSKAIAKRGRDAIVAQAEGAPVIGCLCGMPMTEGRHSPGGCTSLEEFAPNPAQAQSEQAEAERPEMSPERAAYFMRRFKSEEKLLGPNEQAAVDYVLSLLAQHDRIVGALRAENAKLSEALDECDGDRWKLRSERDAANARLHEVATSCATAEQERDAALARVAELAQALRHLLHNIKASGKRIDLGLAKECAEDALARIDSTAPAQAQHSVPGDIMRDAQRYRWLRDQQFYFSFSTENSDAGISSCTAGMSSRFKNLSWVDAAIDSAIAAAPGKEVGHE
ncbi:TPA: hypothetical protein NIB95_002806 [Pseudomonas aeruginosa]|nr:hypothetical protein [Pseudomonas aeruginosa]HCF3737287.1 hypothetical protein [Pseudomonas aeruginosa]